MDTKVVAIIPARNEERFIGSVILMAHMIAKSVVVIDDGSNDHTRDISEAAKAMTISHAYNMGKGAALNTGFKIARELGAEVAVTMDADGQHLPDEMETLLEPIVQGEADVVIGSRYLGDWKSIPWHRVVGHTIFNFVTNRLSGTRITDTQSGFRAFSKNAIEVMCFSSAGFSVESEIQFIAKRERLRILEVPITARYLDRPKRSALAHGLMVANGMVRLTREYRPILYYAISSILLLLTLIAALFSLWPV